MSDKIVINASKQYLNKPINEFVKLIEETANKRYPDYKLGWITNMPENMIEEEIRETGIKMQKLLSLTQTYFHSEYTEFSYGKKRNSIWMHCK